MRLSRAGAQLHRDDARRLPVAAAERTPQRQGNRRRVQHRAAARSDPRRVGPQRVTARGQRRNRYGRPPFLSGRCRRLIAMTDMFRLDGKVAVVTGGGRGIGVMMARGLLQAGATVYLSSRKKAELDAAVAELSVHGLVQAIPADLGTIDGVQALAADLADREDAIHALFNNAGAAWGAPFGEFPESGFDKVLDVNVKGVFLLTRALVPMLTAAATDDDPARVINTGSIDGIVPPQGRDNVSYSAGKAP